MKPNWKIPLFTVIFTLTFWLGGIFGCASQPKGWVPTSEDQFRQVVGETVMRAIDQYRRHLYEQATRMKKDELPKNPAERQKIEQHQKGPV